jgi:hypothetical protein
MAANGRLSILYSQSSIRVGNRQMIPFLTYPLALIALTALPALAAIYFFRNRFRRRKVSSLVLWRFQVQSKEGGVKMNRLQLPLIFFLELLALLLLVTAASGPFWKLPQSTRPLIVILDDSFSMRAVSDNVSAQTRAKIFLQKLFRVQPPPSTRILLAGTEPRLLGSQVRTWNEVSKLLEQWTCRAPSSAIDSALTLAAELGKQQANILVLTDHAPPEKKLSNDLIEWRAFGLPVDNVAIVNASRSALGNEDRCLLEIANFSSKPRDSKLLVESGSNAIQTVELTFAPGEQKRLVFNLPSAAPMLAASVGDDALADDNEIKLLPPIRKKVRVKIVLTNATASALVERALDATGLRASISENPELVIHDSADAFVGSNAWSLRWILPEKPTAYTGPFVIDSAHPLAEGISLQGAVWAANAMTNSAGTVPVILAGNVPLLSAREDIFGRRELTLNLNPDFSTVQSTPDWPILFWNLLDWRISQLPGLLESNGRLGAEMILKTTGEFVSITQPDGVVKNFPRTSDQLSIETPLPGLYSVAMGATTNLFVVNSLAADESNLSQCTTGEWGQWKNDAERRFEEASLVWIIGLAALAVLTTHLFLSAGKKGNA